MASPLEGPREKAEPPWEEAIMDSRRAIHPAPLKDVSKVTLPIVQGPLGDEIVTEWPGMRDCEEEGVLQLCVPGPHKWYGGVGDDLFTTINVTAIRTTMDLLCGMVGTLFLQEISAPKKGDQRLGGWFC